MELRICDFRNSKYQGEAVSKEPAGFGIVLDEKFTFLLTEWANSTPEGPYLAIFDDSTKLYASNNVNSETPLTVYINSDYKIFQSRQNIVVDCSNIRHLLKIVENRIQTMSPKRIKQAIDKKVRVIDNRRYSKESYHKYLSEMLEIEVGTKMLSYQTFIKQTFKAKHRNLFNLTETIKQFTMSFHQDGLFMKLSKNNDKVLATGFIGVNRAIEMGRKYSYNSYNTCTYIEEFINTEPQTSFQYERSDAFETPSQGIRQLLKTQQNSHKVSTFDETKNVEKDDTRSKECIKSLRQYYKRSLTFINKYLNLSGYYAEKNYFDQILKEINFTNYGNHAQVQLQNNGYQLDTNDEPIINKEQTRKGNQFSVEDWKKQLNRYALSRNKSKPSINSEQKIPEQVPQIKKSPKNTGRSPGKLNTVNKTPRKIKQPAISLKETENNQNTNKKPTHDQRVEKSKGHKYIKYLDSDIEDTKRSKVTEKSKQNKDSGNVNQSQRKKSPFSYRFKYTETLQSIGNQTQDPTHREAGYRYY